MFWNQSWMQDSNSHITWGFSYLNDFIMSIMLFFLYLVSSMMFMFLINPLIHKKFDDRKLEFIWTMIPMLFLIGIAMKSLAMLFYMDSLLPCSMTMKVIGHQWYWSYEFADFWTEPVVSSLEFDSYMLSTDNLNNGDFRLLETDLRPALPYNSDTRVVITSVDVLHSWTIPSMGVKADANPGRLNHVKINSGRPGVFYGQCSEICGANHSFMPISVEFMNSNDFLSWLIYEE